LSILVSFSADGDDAIEFERAASELVAVEFFHQSVKVSGAFSARQVWPE
jgi:hypothetical protein